MELFFLVTYDKMRRRYRLALREHDYNDLEIKTLDRDRVNDFFFL
jgi:hypothetical protein